MGIGRDLGLQLREWMQEGLELNGSPALTNRLMDALGAEPTLRAPLRDLAAQPLTLRALRLRGAEQQAALQALHQLLAETYSPRVLQELLDLLEAATGLAAPRPRGAPTPATPAPASPAAAARVQRGQVSVPAPAPAPAAARSQPVARPPRGTAPSLGTAFRRHPGWEAELLAIAPGMLAGAISALVLAWGAQELDRWTFDRLGWTTGVALAAVLLALQLLTVVPPLRSLRRRWLLATPSSADPHRIWSWVRAPWMHAATLETLLNTGLLLILLGTTPLGAGKLVLRYTLTSLACLGAAVLVARRRGVDRRWGGASGAIAALIALAATLSLLKGQELTFQAGPLTIPAWVLLVVNAGLQLSWELPRQVPDDSSSPAARLWSSPWWWGTLGGGAWALITRAGDLLGPLLKAGSGG